MKKNFESVAQLNNRLPKLKYLLLGTIALFVLAPMPTRCFVQLNPFDSHGNPGVIPPGVDLSNTPPLPPHPENTYDCYSPFYSAFWMHPDWRFELHWYFFGRLERDGFLMNLDFPFHPYNRLKVLVIHSFYNSK
jgi:hypothetical protein